MGERAVFLDRDGVLLRAFIKEGRPKPPSGPEEYEILPGAAEAAAALRKAGYKLVVVTNQPDVARGTTTRDAVETINRRLQEDLALDGVYTCYHDNADVCGCRKPKPGLLLQAARDMGIDLAASAMVGDRWSDIEAGRSAGCGRTVLIRASYSEPERVSPDAVTADLAGAAEFLLRASAKERL